MAVQVADSADFSKARRCRPAELGSDRCKQQPCATRSRSLATTPASGAEVTVEDGPPGEWSQLSASGVIWDLFVSQPPVPSGRACCRDRLYESPCPAICPDEWAAVEHECVSHNTTLQTWATARALRVRQ